MSKFQESEFVSLYCEAHRKLWTLAAAVTGDTTLAEDVLQEAAITAMRKLSDFDPESNFVAWMSQIVRFTALNFLKSKKRRNAESLSVHPAREAISHSGVSADSCVTAAGQLQDEQVEFDDDVVNAIESLDPDRRSCFLLRTIHNLAYDEIAEIVGLPEGTAMSHVHRAKVTLRESLSSYRRQFD